MMQRMSLTLLLVLLAASAESQDLTAQVKALTNRPDVARAMAHPGSDRDRILEEWKSLTEINAPSGKERERAEAVGKILETCKLDKVYYDSKGNLIAIRKGTGGRKAVVMDAHLDTVFKEGLKIKAEIRDGKIFAPGSATTLAT
jgi:tripeptide aminopeptidase